MQDYVVIFSQYKNYYVGRGPYLWVYEWYENPTSNVLDLYSDEYFL